MMMGRTPGGKKGKMELAGDGRRCLLVDGTGLSWLVGSLMERILLPVVIVVVIISIIFNKRVNAWEHHCPIPRTLPPSHSPLSLSVSTRRGQLSSGRKWTTSGGQDRTGRKRVRDRERANPKPKRSRTEPGEPRFFK